MRVLQLAAAGLLALLLAAAAARTDEVKEPWQPKASEGNFLPFFKRRCGQGAAPVFYFDDGATSNAIRYGH